MITSTAIEYWQHHQQQQQQQQQQRQQIGFQETNRYITERSLTPLPLPLMVTDDDTNYEPYSYQNQYQRSQCSSTSTPSPWALDHFPETPPCAQQDVMLVNQSFYDPVPTQQQRQQQFKPKFPISNSVTNTTPEISETEMTPNQQKQEHQRFHTVLQAMTAVTQKTETALTYLNRNQTYGIQLVDKLGNDGLIQSQFSIDFHDPAHRKVASSYWKFWIGQHKDPENARSLDLDTHQSIGISNVRYPSFDRITFDWHGRHGAKLFVRFHCLSTDFSRIKGIKGIPLRVCMSSQVPMATHTPLLQRPYAGSFHSNGAHKSNTHYIEQSFCKVKLFRDKGAERKYKDDSKQLAKLFEKILHDGDSSQHPMWLMYNRSVPFTIFNRIFDVPNEISPSTMDSTVNQQLHGKYNANGRPSLLSHYHESPQCYHPYAKRLFSGETDSELLPLPAPQLPPPPFLASSSSSGTITVATQLYFSEHDSVLSSPPSPLMPDKASAEYSVVAQNQHKHDSLVAHPFFYLLGNSKPTQERDQ